MLVCGQHTALAFDWSDLLVPIQVDALDRLLCQCQDVQHGVGCIGRTAGLADLECCIAYLVEADAGVLSGDLDVGSVDLDGVGRVVRAGGQTRVVGQALDVAILSAVLEQPESVAGVFNLAVAVQVTKMLALLALDDVDQVFGMDMLVGEIVLDESVAQELRMLQHQVALLA